MSASWESDETPEYEEMDTIPIFSDDAVRGVARNARGLGIDDERVTTTTHGLIPPSVVLDQLLFDSDPFCAEIIEGTIVIYLAETLHVEGRDRQGVIRATIRADAETHEIDSVALTAELA